MRKSRLIVALMLFLSVLGIAFSLSMGNTHAVTPENVGEFAPDASVDHPWLAGNEDRIQALFVAAYEAQEWTQAGTTLVQPVQLDRARHGLFQIFGEGADFEGALALTEFSGDRVLVIKDPLALTELMTLATIENNNESGILLDVVESEGETYYVTDRRNLDGIFKMVEGVPEYLNLRVGVGTGTYSDIMWNDYNNAYKFSTQFMTSLGLPLGAVARVEYTTRNLNDDGTYNGDATSIKYHTKQQFENGYIMQARMQVRNGDGTLGGHQNVQHPAAPILNDMYALVTGLENNETFNVTGAPVSLEYTIDGVRMQNFEYGYVKVEDGDATFVVDKVVDSKGTEMNRRVGAVYNNWDTWRLSGNSNLYLGRWETLRITQNFRNTFGQIIRDDRIDDHNAGPSLRGSAPNGGLWYGFPGGKEHQQLGAGSIVLYQNYWYLDAYELAPGFNNAVVLFDNLANGGIGRPIAEFVRFEAADSQYQWFENGFAFIHNSRENRAAGGLHIIKNEDFDAWIGEFESVEDKILSLEFDVTFLDRNDEIIEVVKVKYNQTAASKAPTAPVVPDYDFVGWTPNVDTKPIIENTTFKADYAINKGTPETGKIGYLNFDIKEESAEFWYDVEANKITVDDVDLFNAWRHGRDNAADALAQGGLPLYADDTNLVTTLWHFVLDEGVVTKNATIGTVPSDVTTLKSFRATVTINEAVQAIISDSFGDTYVYTMDHLEHDLGLPVGAATAVNRTANTTIFETSNVTTFKVIVQEFEHGFIFQEEYTHAAFPLFGAMLTEWQRLGGLNGEDALGTPLGVPVTYEGVTYQNFTNGYLSYDGTEFTVEYGVVKVDNKGRELDGRAGLTEGRNNVKIGHPDFETEMLRAFLAYQAAFTKILDAGYNLDEVGNAAKFIHEWGGAGISNSFRNSGSTSNVWGLAQHLNVVLRSPDAEAYFIVDEFLNKYAENGMRSALGFPASNVFELEIKVDNTGAVKAEGDITLTVKFQNFVGGYVRVYVYNDAVVVEEFFEGNVNTNGELVVDGDVAAMNPFTLNDPEPADTSALEAKLAELKAQKEDVIALLESDDLADLPKTNKYAPKALLDDINAEITRIEALIASGEMTDAEVLEEIENVEDLMLDLENSTVNGQKEDDTTNPGDDDDDDNDDKEESKGLSIGAIIGIVAGSLVVVGAAVFAIFRFVIKKRV